MAHKELQAIVKDWIRDDENVKAKWVIQETEEDQVIVSGKLKINKNSIAMEVCGFCCTANDDDSIGRALQTINEGILRKLQNLE